MEAMSESALVGLVPNRLVSLCVSDALMAAGRFARATNHAGQTMVKTSE